MAGRPAATALTGMGSGSRRRKAGRARTCLFLCDWQRGDGSGECGSPKSVRDERRERGGAAQSRNLYWLHADHP
jgi:hypothetical protein